MQIECFSSLIYTQITEYFILLDKEVSHPCSSTNGNPNQNLGYLSLGYKTIDLYDEVGFLPQPLCTILLSGTLVFSYVHNKATANVTNSSRVLYFRWF